MMDRDRVVTQLPLVELRDDNGALVEAQRVRDLARGDLRELLQLGPVRFVVADLGSRLRWISRSGSFEFWKREVRDHVHEPTSPYVEDYPDEYFYWASEWRLKSGETVVVLEMVH